MKLSKLYRSLKFKQYDSLKNALIVIKTVEKMQLICLKESFLKLMINSVYRNAMKNLRKIINVRLVNNAKDYKKYVSKPNFISQQKINKNFVAIHGIKPVLILDKLIYVGFSVLGLRKYFMYYFYYNYVRRKYNAKILFTETDSQFIKLKQIMVMKIFIKTSFCLI